MNVRAKSSPLSTFSAVIVPRSSRSTASRGRIAAAPTRRYAPRRDATALESTMGMSGKKRYAVVSCHVERPLDDRTWDAFCRLQERPPGGFRIAAFIRPPDEDAGEDVDEWRVRAAEASARGPLGHHTHWGRPRAGAAERRRPGRAGASRRRARSRARPAARVLLRRRLVHRRVGRRRGGRARLRRLHRDGVQAVYLDDGAPRLSAAEPCFLELGDGRRLLELPTTHTLGMLARGALRLRVPDSPRVHLYFHDSDLLDRRRRLALAAVLGLLARQGRLADLESVHAELAGESLPRRGFANAAPAR